MSEINQIKELSVAQLCLVYPEFGDMLERSHPENYDAFVSRLVKDIDQAITRLEQNRHHHQEHSEDEITSYLIGKLQSQHYDAEHDTQHGGHCDILVKHNRKDYTWIGEAKIWKGKSYVLGGFNQLTTRYASGTPNHNHGGILIYCRLPNAKEKMNEWLSHLTSETDSVITDELPNNGLRFSSQHTHQSSGLEYNIRHFVAVLNHSTTDESRDIGIHTNDSGAQSQAG